MRTSHLLATVLGFSMFVTGCATQAQIKKIMGEQIAPLQQQVAAVEQKTDQLVVYTKLGFAESDRLFQQIAERQIEFQGQTKQELDQLHGKTNLIFRELPPLKKEVKGLRKETKDFRAENKKAHDDLSTTVTAVDGKVGKVQTDLSAHASDTKTVLGTIDHKVDGITMTVNHTDGTVTRIESDTSANTAAIARIEGQVTSIEGATTTNTATLGRVEGGLTTLAPAVTSLGVSAGKAEKASDQAALDAKQAAADAAAAKAAADNLIKAVCDIGVRGGSPKPAGCP